MATEKPNLFLLASSLLAGCVLAGVAYAAVMSRSDSLLTARRPLPPSAVTATTDPAVIARGAHLISIMGCTTCHGADLAGGHLNVVGAPYDPPNLSRRIGRMSDAELDRAVRGGLKPDGTTEVAMPSHSYVTLSNDEARSIVSDLRTVAPKGSDAPDPAPGFLLRAYLSLGFFKTEAAELASARPPLDAGDKVEAGRHLAAISCGRCHGADLGGIKGMGPDMTVRGYYNRQQFFALMRKGEMIAEGNTELMAQASKSTFVNFSDAEIDQIYAYLNARDRILAAKPPQH